MTRATPSSTLMVAILFLAGCGNTTGQPANSASQDANGMVMDQQSDHSKNPYYSTTDTKKLDVPLAEWKTILPPDLYHVAFEQGTERPFTGKFKEEPTDGIFRCAVCGNELFEGRTKFDSGTGWPSFYQPAKPNDVKEQADGGSGMMYSEVLCSRCGAHLGHVFDDGPDPTGLRYCINAVSLDLEKGK